MPKNVLTTLQLHTFDMLARSCSKPPKQGFNSKRTENFQMFKLDLEKLPFLNPAWTSGTRDQIANIHWIIEKAREFKKNIYFCFIDYAKAFDCVDQNKLWKILKKMGIADHLTCLWETCMKVNNQQWRTTTQNNRLVQKWERRMSRLYIVTLLI